MNRNKLYHLGIKQNFEPSTLSRVNEDHDWQIITDFGRYLINLFIPISPMPNVDIDNVVFALDSTTISLRIEKFQFREAGVHLVKFHFLLFIISFSSE